MSTSASEAVPRSTVVIGLGNPLMGDDGLGLAALSRLGAIWDLPDGVELVDGGTWGMNLLPVIEDAARVLLVDAINVGAPPGAPIVLPRERLPRYFATKLSPHQIDLREVLALAELRGRLPEQTTAIGMQPQAVTFGAGLSEALSRQLDPLVVAIVQVLAEWGHVCRRKPAFAGA